MGTVVTTMMIVMVRRAAGDGGFAEITRRSLSVVVKNDTGRDNMVIWS